MMGVVRLDVPAKVAKVEERALETFNTRPKIWHRYVDDLFAMVKAHLVEKLLEHLKAPHPSITQQS